MTNHNHNNAQTNGWFNTQQKMVEQWFNLFSSAAPNHPGNLAENPFGLLFPGLAEQWRAYAEQSLKLFTSDHSRQAETVTQQFFASQGQMLQLVRMISEAWQSILADAQSPEEWQKALKAYTEQMRQQLTDAVNPAQFMQSSGELWSLYLQTLQKWSLPWLQALADTPHDMSGGLLDPTNPNPWLALSNSYWQAFEQTFGRLFAAPSFGLTREFNEKVNKAFTLWLENQQATLNYQRLLSNAWVNAFQALMQKLLALAQSGKTLENQKQLINLWVEVGDEQFLALFHSDEYAAVQSKVVNSGMALRRQLREINEVWLRAQDLPTRSELDEAHHQIYELRKEVKALKKAMVTGATQAVQSSATSAAKPAKRRTAKPIASQERA
ncbi:MAG: poly(R)-hydroxyalkanoic acid synthase subunit PhaE [Caldilineaceae bacterium]